jgi:hypothetical protein
VTAAAGPTVILADATTLCCSWEASRLTIPFQQRGPAEAAADHPPRRYPAAAEALGPRLLQMGVMPRFAPDSYGGPRLRPWGSWR